MKRILIFYLSLLLLSDLGWNKLKYVRGSPLVQMPNLIFLGITGNMNLTLNWNGSQDTSSTNPTMKVKGPVKSCPKCKNRTRSNTNNKRRTGTLVQSTFLYGCFSKTEEYTLYEANLTSSNKCKNRTCPARSRVRKTQVNVCWNVRRQLRVVEFILGVLAILLNFVVLTTVALARSLRKSVSFFLVAHLAFCDILLGVYAVGIGIGHAIETKAGFLLWAEKYCTYFGSMFILNQVVGVITAILVTCERYLAIVFCMNPGLKLRRKTALLILLVSWVLAIALCVSVQIFDGKDVDRNEMCLITRNSSKISRIFLSEILLIVVGVIYLLIFAMYVHIFIEVRRSSRNAGIRRESRLARRIGIVVLSSMVLFVLPNIYLAVFIIRGGGVFSYAVLNKILLWWLPPMCLLTNSCINPCFFAYRNDTFMKQLKQQLQCCFQKPDLNSRKLPGSTGNVISKNDDLMNSSQLTITETIELHSFAQSASNGSRKLCNSS